MGRKWKLLSWILAGNERAYQIKYKFGGWICASHFQQAASLPPWGQIGKRGVRLPSHTPLLAALLSPRDHLCAAGSDKVTAFIPPENVYSQTLEIALEGRPINFLLTLTFPYLETQDESILE